MDTTVQSAVDFLTGSYPYAAELQAFCIGFQGAMAIRNSRNRYKELPWFHAFVLSVFAGYGGGCFGFLWMGRPSSMISSDINLGACILAFIIANYTPFDIGYKIGNSLPVAMVTVVFAQLFRTKGLVTFITVAFNAFKDTPTPYYPIPVLGPVLYGTLLGCWGGVALKGVDGFVGGGMPWPVYNGVFIGSWFHFYAHDKTGPVGQLIRNLFTPMQNLYPEIFDDRTFANVGVSIFMQVTGLLQLPAFLGPTFNPFRIVADFVTSPLKSSTDLEVPAFEQDLDESTSSSPTKTNRSSYGGSILKQTRKKKKSRSGQKKHKKS